MIRVSNIEVYWTCSGVGVGWPFTMGWIDCLLQGSSMGRDVLQRGRWATEGEAPRPFPPR
jgi:hypothetical protein